MSEVFNWKRFSKWYLHDWKNIWKNYKINLLLTGLMPFSLFLVFGFVTMCFTGEWHLPDTFWRIMMFVVAGAIFIMSFPAMSYGNITDKKIGAQWILLPASREEKFISMMLNTLLLTPVLFLSMYACADALLSFLGLAEGKTLYALFTEFNNDRVYIDINVKLFIFFSISIYALVFLVGAVYFKKRKVSGTVLALFILQIIVSSLLGLFVMFPGMTYEDIFFAHRENIELAINIFIYIAILFHYLILGGLVFVKLKTIKY